MNDQKANEKVLNILRGEMQIKMTMRLYNYRIR